MSTRMSALFFGYSSVSSCHGIVTLPPCSSSQYDETSFCTPHAVSSPSSNTISRGERNSNPASATSGCHALSIQAIRAW